MYLYAISIVLVLVVSRCFLQVYRPGYINILFSLQVVKRLSAYLFPKERVCFVQVASSLNMPMPEL